MKLSRFTTVAVNKKRKMEVTKKKVREDFTRFPGTPDIYG